MQHPEAPFPLEFQEPAKWPGKTATRRYHYLYDYISPGAKPGTYTYGGRHLTAEAAAALRQSWEARYILPSMLAAQWAVLAA